MFLRNRSIGRMVHCCAGDCHCARVRRRAPLPGNSPMATATIAALRMSSTAPAGKGSVSVPGLGYFYPGAGPVIAPDGTVYLGTRQGKLIALHADGKPFWSRDITPRPDHRRIAGDRFRRLDLRHRRGDDQGQPRQSAEGDCHLHASSLQQHRRLVGADSIPRSRGHRPGRGRLTQHRAVRRRRSNFRPDFLRQHAPRQAHGAVGRVRSERAGAG